MEIVFILIYSTATKTTKLKYHRIWRSKLLIVLNKQNIPFHHCILKDFEHGCNVANYVLDHMSCKYEVCVVVVSFFHFQFAFTGFHWYYVCLNALSSLLQNNSKKGVHIYIRGCTSENCLCFTNSFVCYRNWTKIQ